MTDSHPPSPKHRQVWLDKLPEETCEKIAMYVSNGRRTGSALSLAETSELQRQAVLASLSYELDLSYPATPKYVQPSTLPSRWAAVFTGHIRKIQTVSRPAHVHVNYFLELFQASTLRTAIVSDEPLELGVLSKSTSLRELSVSIYNASWEKMSLGIHQHIAPYVSKTELSQREWVRDPPFASNRLGAHSSEEKSDCTHFEVRCQPPSSSFAQGTGVSGVAEANTWLQYEGI